MKQKLATAFLVGVLAIGAAHANEPIRLDASSDAAAESSWKKMTEMATPEKKQKLLIAMLQINMAGVNSAYDVVRNPELQSLGIARIKDKVSGLTADEIIELGGRTSTIQVQPAGK